MFVALGYTRPMRVRHNVFWGGEYDNLPSSAANPSMENCTGYVVYGKPTHRDISGFGVLRHPFQLRAVRVAFVHFRPNLDNSAV